MLERFRESDPLADVRAAVAPEEVAAAQAAVRKVHVSEDVAAYVVALVRATRESALVRLGASPRASLALQRAAQASAALDGRGFVVPDDVQALAEPGARAPAGARPRRAPGRRHGRRRAAGGRARRARARGVRGAGRRRRVRE